MWGVFVRNPFYDIYDNAETNKKYLLFINDKFFCEFYNSFIHDYKMVHLNSRW